MVYICRQVCSLNLVPTSGTPQAEGRAVVVLIGVGWPGWCHYLIPVKVPYHIRTIIPSPGPWRLTHKLCVSVETRSSFADIDNVLSLGLVYLFISNSLSVLHLKPAFPRGSPNRWNSASANDGRSELSDKASDVGFALSLAPHDILKRDEALDVLLSLWTLYLLLRVLHKTVVD